MLPKSLSSPLINPPSCAKQSAPSARIGPRFADERPVIPEIPNDKKGKKRGGNLEVAPVMKETKINMERRA